MTCRQVVGRNAYSLGHVKPILAKKLMVVGQNVVMVLALYLPSTTHVLYSSTKLRRVLGLVWLYSRRTKYAKNPT